MDRFLTPLIFVVLCGVLGFLFRNEIRLLIAHPQSGPSSQISKVILDPPKVAAVYERLKLKPLPDELAANDDIRRALKDLTESGCDKTAIFRLANAVFEAGEKRLASDAFLGFANSCPNSEGELNAAANMLYSMGDYAAVIPIADKLVSQRPEIGQYYYLRGQAFEATGKNEEAVRDYASAMGLVDDLKQVNDSVFTHLASSYAAIAKFCQAMTTIQTYVYADVATRDTAAARKLIDDYATKGKCELNYANGSETIPRTQQGVILANVSVNGARGRFVIDTGASLVAIDPAFAKKAKIKTENASTVVIHTANGIGKATLATAERVETGKVTAENVTVAINEKPFGGDIDGLLGMSFLARFDVTLGEKEIRIQSRGKPPSTQKQ